MKIIIIVLTLSLLLVNADDQYCNGFIKQYNMFRNRCSLKSITINSCCDLRAFSMPSGVYKLNKGTFNTADVYCDMKTTGGGWIVIQRNRNGSLVDFNKNWIDYEKGFGDLSTEFWYGLEATHCFLQRGQWEMRMDYQFNNGSWTYVYYKYFHVANAKRNYLLTVREFTGMGINDFAHSNKTHFRTPDRDTDGSCAARNKSGWWYKNCHTINPNAQPPVIINDQSVRFIEMKIRPKDCINDP